MTTEKSLITRDQISDIMPIEYLKQQTRQLEELYKGLMQPGTDYGKIPGSDKPTLFKSGAELLRLRARLDPHFTIDDTGTDLRQGIFNYLITCDLSRDGEHIGAGVGSCNSLESKYRYRWVFESALPKGIEKASLPFKRFQSKGRWYITYRIENENPQDLANTILKMAKKRAFVDAILTVTGASRIFTQDVEDMVEPESVEETPEVKAKPQPEAQSGPSPSKDAPSKQTGAATAIVDAPEAGLFATHEPVAKSTAKAIITEGKIPETIQELMTWAIKKDKTYVPSKVCKVLGIGAPTEIKDIGRAFDELKSIGGW